MPSIKKLGLGLLAAALLGVPSTAQAQYFFGGSPGGLWGNYYGNYGYGFGGLPGASYNYYNPAWTYGSPYYSNIYPRYSPIILPGFGASDPLRTRSTLYPAIPEPAPEIIQSALEANEKDKARIDLHVPTAAAKVYLDGVLTKQTGLDRMYITPTLNPAAKYAMTVDVVWQTDSGRNRTVRRQLNLRAGELATLDLRDGD